MFNSLPQHFRKYKLSADVRTLMQLRKSIERGLVHTLGDLFLVLKGLITKSPQEYGPFTAAFYQYFLNITIKPGESLNSAVIRSDPFDQWKATRLKDIPEEDHPLIRELIDEFLNEVHLSTYDIKNLFSGEDILAKDDPDRKDDQVPTPRISAGKAEEMADYSQIPLEELLERMRKVAQQQRRAHTGGRHWIGTGGYSPYGQQGAAAGGIRTGGMGGAKMARRVIGDRNFYAPDTDALLQDNNIDIALSYLKGIEDETSEMLLDIPKTIKEGVKQGGLFLPYEKEKIEKKVQVILLIDNGGWSMTPYIPSVTKLFSKMKRRFAHELKTYYYHNSIYKGVYSDIRRTQFEPMDKILAMDKNYSVFVVGDADMAPYELTQKSIDNWQSLRDRFPRMVWMNPLDVRHWAGSLTVSMLRRLIPMFPLSPHGVEKAVELMNKQRLFKKL